MIDSLIKGALAGLLLGVLAVMISLITNFYNKISVGITLQQVLLELQISICKKLNVNIKYILVGVIIALSTLVYWLNTPRDFEGCIEYYIQGNESKKAVNNIYGICKKKFSSQGLPKDREKLFECVLSKSSGASSNHSVKAFEGYCKKKYPEKKSNSKNVKSSLSKLSTRELQLKLKKILKEDLEKGVPMEEVLEKARKAQLPHDDIVDILGRR